jgi:hypothetical protein
MDGGTLHRCANVCMPEVLLDMPHPCGRNQEDFCPNVVRLNEGLRDEKESFPAPAQRETACNPELQQNAVEATQARDDARLS